MHVQSCCFANQTYCLLVTRFMVGMSYVLIKIFWLVFRRQNSSFSHHHYIIFVCLPTKFVSFVLTLAPLLSTSVQTLLNIQSKKRLGFVVCFSLIEWRPRDSPPKRVEAGMRNFTAAFMQRWTTGRTDGRVTEEERPGTRGDLL